MSWMRFSHGFRLDPIAEGSPEAVVVMLHDLGSSTAALVDIALRWAAAVPTTSFLAFDGIDRLDLFGPDAGPNTLDRTALRLEAVLDRYLDASRLNTGRVVLVGFGYGGTLALHMSLDRGWGCAGVLAFTAKPTVPLQQHLRGDSKIRLIKCLGDGCADNGSLHDMIGTLTQRGIDTRGVLLNGSALSDEAVRHGGAYLVELVANAQRSGRAHALQERQP